MSWLATTVSLESVLSKLMLLGTVKLRTLGKAAVVVEKVAKASSLRYSEPAINLPIPFSKSSFMGVQTPEYIAPCLTGLPIKNYGPALHVLGWEGKLHSVFL